ncbi:hypothetical protein ABPG77_004697 [Micractinium sp. CCAP 211/92]
MAAASKEMVERPGAVCDWVAAHGKQVQGWMAGVAAWQSGASASGNRSSRQGLPADIFSRYQFPGSGITAPIEPLVGHLRMLCPQWCLTPCAASSAPLSTCHPRRPACRAHILPLGLTPQQFRQLYPGRALLMDFGSSDFKTSVGWLMPRYAALGVELEEIWGYELREMDLNKYWRSRVRPGDFLVIKLDIDSADVELPFVRAIAADAELRALIGELHFEMHYTHRDMPWFGTSGGSVTLSDVLTLFTDLRQKGLRLHYWP